MSDIKEVSEELEKGKCVRCGGKTSGGKGGRCASCLKKLSTKRATPGSKERSWKHADQAIRRENGASGTTTGGHKSGHGKRQEIQRKMQTAEKKTGQKLSLDRKNNERGYESKNTRAIPEKLNVGRHKANPKKLRAWKKKLKKSEIDTASLYTLMKAKYQDNPDTLELLKSLGSDGLEQYIELFDCETPLSKNDQPQVPAAPAAPVAPAPTTSSLKDHVGQVHTVEIHPDMDLMYRAKGLFKENNKPSIHISNLKKAGMSDNIVSKLPRDAKGNVTPEMIDKHIEGLPKTKVNVRVLSAENRPDEQKHRSDAPEHILSMNLHPEEKAKMSPRIKEMWDHAKTAQHTWFPNDNKESKSSALKDADQIGWSRIDSNHFDGENKQYKDHDHWHLDEVQSDFQHDAKIKKAIDRVRHGDDPEWQQAYDNMNDALNGHEDYKDHPIHGDAEHIHEQAEDAYPVSMVEDTHGDEKHEYDENENKREDFANEGLIDLMSSHADKEYAKKKDRLDLSSISDQDRSQLFDHLSHGHEDPQHMIHSATNALGRKLGIKSMSMDTPEDQAEKSALRTTNSGDSVRVDVPENEHIQGWNGLLDKHMNNPQNKESIKQNASDLWSKKGQSLVEKESKEDPLFGEVANKLGSKGMQEFAEQLDGGTNGWMYGGSHDEWDKHKEHPISDELKSKLSNMSNDEKDAISTFMNKMSGELHEHVADKIGIGKRPAHDSSSYKYVKQEADPKTKKPPLPVHQVNTYNKRPKKLGMKEVEKNKILGQHSQDKPDHKIQYMNLHKKLHMLMEELRKTKK